MSMQTICNDIAKKIGAVKQKGYEEGFAAGKASGGGGMDTFWDAYFASQQRSKASYAIQGGGWDETTFKPDRTINAENLGVTTANGLFSYSSFEVFPEFLDDGVTPILDTSGFESLNSLFANATSVTRILAPIDLSGCTNMNYAFAGATKLEKVTLKHVQTVTSWTSAFNSKNLTDIGQENDDFGYFSASVDLSKTAINFGTPKMCLYNLLVDVWWSQSYSYLSLSKDCTLTISQKQLDDANNYLNEYWSPEVTFNAVVTGGLGWELAVV